jgi:hypothetical protein
VLKGLNRGKFNYPQWLDPDCEEGRGEWWVVDGGNTFGVDGKDGS